MARNIFQNPANGETYVWQRNHDPDGEEEAGKVRNVQRIPNTSLIGIMLSQGDDGPYIIKLRGKIVHRNQLRQFWHFYAISERQTIYFTDFDGQSYEVQMTSFLPKRRGKLSGIKPDPSAPQHFWEYSMELTVINFRAGDMFDMGVKP